MLLLLSYGWAAVSLKEEVETTYRSDAAAAARDYRTNLRLRFAV